jgi:MFS family permease
MERILLSDCFWIVIYMFVIGFSFGIGLTYPLCGFLIAHFGWRVVFYVTGSVGILWCLIWWLLAFDTPAQHPRISASERRYIETNVGNTVVGEKVSNIAVALPACSNNHIAYLELTLLKVGLDRCRVSCMRKMRSAYKILVGKA